MRRRCSPGWGGWCGRRGLARCVGVFEDLADPCLEIVVVMGGVGVTSWLTLAG